MCCMDIPGPPLHFKHHLRQLQPMTEEKKDVLICLKHQNLKINLHCDVVREFAKLKYLIKDVHPTNILFYSSTYVKLINFVRHGNFQSQSWSFTSHSTARVILGQVLSIIKTQR